MFESLTERLQAVFGRLQKRGVLREADVDEALREVRLALLEADVHYRVVKDFLARVRERAVGAEVSQALSPAQQVIKIVYEELVATLGEPGRLELKGQAPYIIMAVGLQGSGKTTTVAKLARYLRERGHLPMMVAADTYRPAAVTQLEVLGQKLGIPVYSEGVEADPPDICVRGVQEARRRGYDVVVLDTAGRLQIDEEMMRELEAIVQRVRPVEILLVADAMTGQEAVNIADGFHKRLGLTGLILTKVDGDARGGAAISMRAVTGVPIKFLGTGEKLDALEVFHPERLASRILGMGDVLTLIERAEAAFDAQQARRMAEKIQKAEFDLEDFLEQLRELRKGGLFAAMMDLLPGVKKLKAQASPDERQLKRMEAIICSMTREERRRPEIINGSRRRRIARGAGTSVEEVNRLLRQWAQTKKLMRSMQGKDPRRVLRGLGL